MYPNASSLRKNRKYRLILVLCMCLAAVYNHGMRVNAYAMNGKENAPVPLPAPLSRSERQAEIIRRARRKVAKVKVRDLNERIRQDKVQSISEPERPLQPPFPNGVCGGRLVTLSPADLKFVDGNGGNNDNDNEGTASTTATAAASAPAPAPTAITAGFDPILLPPRNITVWLPPDYDAHPEMRFPVLYCHDGQNAMEDSISWTGHSWRLAGALTRLAERNMLTKTTITSSPPIVVMMPCAEDRIAQVVPRRHLEYGDISLPFAQAHADFVGLTLKPLIDAEFRTQSEKEYTSTIGSSLGGQASLHLIMRFPDLFGKAACLSPAFQPSILTSVAASDDRMWTDKEVYIDNGGDVDDVKVPILDVQDHLSKEHWWNPGYWWLDSQLQPGIDAMKLALDAKGIDYTYKRFAGGRHNERGWASRIDKPLMFLYGKMDQST